MAKKKPAKRMMGGGKTSKMQLQYGGKTSKMRKKAGRGLRQKAMRRGGRAK